MMLGSDCSACCGCQSAWEIVTGRPWLLSATGLTISRTDAATRIGLAAAHSLAGRNPSAVLSDFNLLTYFKSQPQHSFGQYQLSLDASPSQTYWVTKEQDPQGREYGTARFIGGDETCSITADIFVVPEYVRALSVVPGVQFCLKGRCFDLSSDRYVMGSCNVFAAVRFAALWYSTSSAPNQLSIQTGSVQAIIPFGDFDYAIAEADLYSTGGAGGAGTDESSAFSISTVRQVALAGWRKSDNLPSGVQWSAGNRLVETFPYNCASRYDNTGVGAVLPSLAFSAPRFGALQDRPRQWISYTPQQPFIQGLEWFSALSFFSQASDYSGSNSTRKAWVTRNYASEQYASVGSTQYGPLTITLSAL